MEPTQKLRKKFVTPFEKASVYYKLLSDINNLGLGDKQIALLSYLAIGGTKKSFCEQFGSSAVNADNLLMRLRKKGVIQKDNTIHPSIHLDFESPLNLQIFLDNEY